MVNGVSSESKEKRVRLEVPLLDIDAVIQQLADENGPTVVRNHKDWPDRPMGWSSNNVRCLIQL